MRAGVRRLRFCLRGFSAQMAAISTSPNIEKHQINCLSAFGKNLHNPGAFHESKAMREPTLRLSSMRLLTEAPDVICTAKGFHSDNASRQIVQEIQHPMPLKWPVNYDRSRPISSARPQMVLLRSMPRTLMYIGCSALSPIPQRYRWVGGKAVHPVGSVPV